jgi:hypothetical protein
MRYAVIFPSILLLWSVPASAADFSCSNPGAEIRCADGKCEFLVPPEGFTPMHLSKTGPTLSICAYSGCWTGPVTLRRTVGQVSLIRARVKADGNATSEVKSMSDFDDISVIYNGDSHSAQMTWAGFSNVMECEKN